MGSFPSCQSIKDDELQEKRRSEIKAFFVGKRLCVFSKPPEGNLVDAAILEQVESGDTLILADGDHTRVRLLAIEIPPIHSSLCCDMLRLLCPMGCKIFVQYTGSEWKDALGRLAYIFAPHPDEKRLVCLNLALLEYGVASLFVSRKGPPVNIKALMSAQTAARTARRNMWGNVEEESNVLISEAGNLFHRVGSGCDRVGREQIVMRLALDMMYSPCPTCKPLQLASR